MDKYQKLQAAYSIYRDAVREQILEPLGAADLPDANLKIKALLLISPEIHWVHKEIYAKPEDE